jgi:hypothetical protein
VQDYLFVWGANHLIADGHSLNIMFREIWLVYGELIRGRPSPSQQLSANFSDYQMWQRASHRTWLEKHRSYWRHRLDGAVGIRWPGNKCCRAGAHGAIKPAAISLSSGLSRGLRCLAQQAKTMLSLCVMTVYVAVVARCCNQNDFVFATTSNGRDRLQQLHIVGFLAHFMYLRMQLNGDETFAELLELVVEEYRRTLINKDFGGLVSETPELLSGTYFQWLSWGIEKVSGSPTPAESNLIELTGEQFPFERVMTGGENSIISTLLWNTNEGISGVVYFREDVFPTETIEQFVQEFRATAERFVENPFARVL